MIIIRKLRALKNKIRWWWNNVGKYRVKKVLHPKASFFVLSCNHSNLGDHAISFAMKEMFKELNVKYIEVSSGTLSYLRAVNKLNLFNKRNIYVAGGGNLGTLWFEVEKTFRQLIISNPDSNVVLFPNTIYYENTEWGQEELKNSINIYNAHKSLKIYAREKTSYEFMKPIYSDVSLVPDMVLMLDKSDYNFDREGCILCLRKDLEKTRSDVEEQTIIAKANELFSNQIEFFDMVRDYPVSIKDREEELDKAFKKFAKSKLVITDRLHAMIFSAITGTPCIVINSASPKVKGCYKWIEHLDYIKFCNSVEDIEKLYNEIPIKAHKYDNSPFARYYDKLKEDLKNINNK